MLKPPIALHQSLLSPRRLDIEAEGAKEQVVAPLVPRTQAVWGCSYCQASGKRSKCGDHSVLSTHWPILLRIEGPDLSLPTLDFLCQVRKQNNGKVRYM